jgi:hypothetical protein
LDTIASYPEHDFYPTRATKQREWVQSKNMQCAKADTDLDRATTNVGALKLYNGIGCTFVSVEPDKTKDDVSLGFS